MSLFEVENRVFRDHACNMRVLCALLAWATRPILLLPIVVCFGEISLCSGDCCELFPLPFILPFSSFNFRIRYGSFLYLCTFFPSFLFGWARVFLVPLGLLVNWGPNVWHWVCFLVKMAPRNPSNPGVGPTLVICSDATCSGLFGSDLSRLPHLQLHNLWLKHQRDVEVGSDDSVNGGRPWEYDGRIWDPTEMCLYSPFLFLSPTFLGLGGFSWAIGPKRIYGVNPLQEVFSRLYKLSRPRDQYL